MHGIGGSGASFNRGERQTSGGKRFSHTHTRRVHDDSSGVDECEIGIRPPRHV